MTKDHRLDLTQWLNYSRETYEGYGYEYEFIGVTDIQLKIEKTEPSLGSSTKLPPVLRSKTKPILNIGSHKFNCHCLCITAALYPVTEHATRENKYIINLVQDSEENENVYDYLARIQKNYKINLWFYGPTAMLHHRPRAEHGHIPIQDSKVELLEKSLDLVKGRKNVKILIWDEHCALIKNVEVLLERPNTKHAKF